MSAKRFVRRMRIGSEADLGWVLSRLAAPPSGQASVAASVSATLEEVKRRGDEALVRHARAFDWPCPGPEAMRVPQRELRRAAREAPEDLAAALSAAARSIRRFHEGQAPASCATLRGAGWRAGVRPMPLESVGLYVPGGRAAYPSTLLMLAIPARIAGVKRIAVACPAGPDGLPPPSMLSAARMLGLQEVYALGGAAAIGAFAYGTHSVARVDKIFGPGNAYVAEAKRQVFGAVGVDSIAGPTELVILSDGTSPARLIAADLLAQAEHDAMASPVLLTTDEGETERVEGELQKRLEGSPRAGIQRRSLAGRGALVWCASEHLACAAARALAPEHLSVQTEGPRRWARRVPTAAAVFLGPFTPEAAGDYGAGPNHSLPTGGSARFASPVAVWDFFRYQSYLQMDHAALRRSAPWMGALARAEGLFGHDDSLSAREETA